MTARRIPFSGSSPDPYYAMERPESKELKAMMGMVGALVLIQGPRRIGKTTMVRQAVPESRLIEANLYGAKSYQDCEMIVANAIESYVGAESEVETVTKAEGSIFGFGASAQFRKAKAGDLLRKSFDLLIRKAELDGAPVLFIDEAQTVLEATEGMNFAKRLRTELQRSLHCVSAVFAGSNSSALKRLHSDNSSPFYKQLESLGLKPLDRGEFYEWADARLRKHKLQITKESFLGLCDFCRDVCGDIQRVLESTCYRIEPGRKIGKPEIAASIDRITKTVRNDSLPIINGLNSNQLALYVFLSLRNRISPDIPLKGRDAQTLLGGMNTGTIARALESLAKSGLVTHWEGRIFPDSPFLEEAILRIHPNITEGMSRGMERILKDDGYGESLSV